MPAPDIHNSPTHRTICTAVSDDPSALHTTYRGDCLDGDVGNSDLLARLLALLCDVLQCLGAVDADGAQDVACETGVNAITGQRQTATQSSYSFYGHAVECLPELVEKPAAERIATDNAPSDGGFHDAIISFRRVVMTDLPATARSNDLHHNSKKPRRTIRITSGTAE